MYFFLQGLQKRSLPLILCLKVQYYVENGRLIWYVLLLMINMHRFNSWILVLLFGFICVFPLHCPLPKLSHNFCTLPFSLWGLCGSSERKARHLYYSDLRERVLRSECRQQEEVYFQLAGYALQADLGDHPVSEQGMKVAPYFEPKEYFPPWVGVTKWYSYEENCNFFFFLISLNLLYF